MIEYFIYFFSIAILYKGIKVIINRKKKLQELGPFPVMKGAEPFFIKKGKIGCLLLHGFTSTPNEFRFLRDYLTKKNITVYAPLLKGHGTDPIELANTNWQDWYKDAKNALDKLKKRCNKIILIGNSAGGNLAVMLAAEENVDGLILLGTPIRFRLNKAVRFLLPIINKVKKFQRKGFQARIRKIDNDKVHYKVLPLNKLYDIFKIMHLTKENLAKIKAPTLVMQTETDFMITKSNAEYIYNNLKSEKRKLCFIPDSYHVFIVDKNREIAFTEIYNFIKEFI